MRAGNELAGITDSDHLPWVCFCPSTNAGLFLTRSHRPVRCFPSRLPGSDSGLDLTEKEVYKQATQFLQVIRGAAQKSSDKTQQSFACNLQRCYWNPGSRQLEEGAPSMLSCPALIARHAIGRLAFCRSPQIVFSKSFCGQNKNYI